MRGPVLAGGVKVGEGVVVLGNPLGLNGSVSTGIVSGLRQLDGVGLIQITAPVSPGSSGSPVLNDKGEVVGVVAGMSATGGQNLNFAIGRDDLEAALARYMACSFLQLQFDPTPGDPSWCDGRRGPKGK